MGRPADLQRGREHRADRGRHPRGAAGRDAARRRRRLARRHRTAGRRAGRRRPADPGPPSRRQAGPRPRVPRRLHARPRRAAPRSSSRWTRTSATIRAPCRLSSPRSATGTADLVIGSRYTQGGGVVDWGLGRRVVSRGGSIFARVVLGLGPHDLTGGFKAWRAATLAAVPFDGVHAGGYVFQIEMTFRAGPGRRAHPRDPDHVPRPPGRSVEDEPADRRRGARRRRPAARRGAARPAAASARILTDRERRTRPAPG